LLPKEPTAEFRVLIDKDEDGMFVAEVSYLSGCISQGHTRTEAVRNVNEAIANYHESLRDHDDPIPPSIAE